MANAMLDARQEEGAYQRVEVITGRRRRRRWTAEEKGRIVAESFEEGANISEVARRHGVVRGLLTVWRRQVSQAMAAKGQAFVRVRVAGGATSAGPTAPSCGPAVGSAPVPRTVNDPGGIEIDLCGARIRVAAGVDAGTLTMVLTAVRGGR